MNEKCSSKKLLLQHLCITAAFLEITPMGKEQPKFPKAEYPVTFFSAEMRKGILKGKGF